MGAYDQPVPPGVVVEPPPRKPPCCPIQMAIFTINLLIGLAWSSTMPLWAADGPLDNWKLFVKICTMWCLSYIMVHVGYEFDIDKTRLGSYAKDYLVAMTAASFPWAFVALWFIFALPTPLDWVDALLAARFAAPTSAGILFSMLEAAGMKETWLFKKARILAIFDDLDTILLMIPLKVLVVGAKWELAIDLTIIIILLVVLYVFLHAVRIPNSWQFTMLYASLVTIFCELLHFFTHDCRIDPGEKIDTVHLEVLLPAFTIGCIARAGRHTNMPQPGRALGDRSHSFFMRARATPSIIAERVSRIDEHKVNTIISATFMLFVGLSMPPLVDVDDGDGSHRMLAVDEGCGDESHRMLAATKYNGTDPSEEETMAAGTLIFHVAMVSLLMIVGKMFPCCVYRDEADFKTRFALSLGMCPRGEVGAGVIVISLAFGIEGDAISIAVIALAVNLILSSLFILGVKSLAGTEGEGVALEAKPTEGGAEPAELDTVATSPRAETASNGSAENGSGKAGVGWSEEA